NSASQYRARSLCISPRRLAICIYDSAASPSTRRVLGELCSHAEHGQGFRSNGGRSMSSIRNATICMAVSCALVALAPESARADEGGVSMWVPGFFGSLAATPQTPGFSVAFIYYHTSLKAGADVAFARQVSRGNIT